MYERGGDDGVCLERGRKISAKGKWKGGGREANGVKENEKGARI